MFIARVEIKMFMINYDDLRMVKTFYEPPHTSRFVEEFMDD